MGLHLNVVPRAIILRMIFTFIRFLLKKKLLNNSPNDCTPRSVFLFCDFLDRSKNLFWKTNRTKLFFHLLLPPL
ncbi:hypothetical protein ABH19_10750 [Leptospirillum sp. Group II 'CF-1']|nr:hypothetical protein ABH19_10750 [Leptospirillum sp. Group II 'CF-1']